MGEGGGSELCGGKNERGERNKEDYSKNVIDTSRKHETPGSILPPHPLDDSYRKHFFATKTTSTTMKIMLMTTIVPVASLLLILPTSTYKRIAVRLRSVSLTDRKKKEMQGLRNLFAMIHHGLFADRPLPCYILKIRTTSDEVSCTYPVSSHACFGGQSNNNNNNNKHVRRSSRGTTVCKSRATRRAPITYNVSCATWYETDTSV